MDSSAINWALEDLTSSESPYSNRTCPLPWQLPLLRWGSTLLLSTILLDLSHSKQTDNFTGVSDQRFTATISAQVSINPWSVCQKLLYFCFPHQCLNFLTKLHCWQLSTLILSLLTLPPYPPQSPLVLTSPINILFFSLPHSTTVWTSCKQGLATATHPAPQPVPGGTGIDIPVPVIWLPFTSILGSGSTVAWSKQVEPMSWGSPSLQMLTFRMPHSWFSQKSCLKVTASTHKHPTPYLHQPHRSYNPRAYLYIAFFWINCIWRS